jgi:hypothetical protein
MGYRFTITKRVFEKNAVIAFIDLLGTRELYEKTSTEEQAKRILYALLDEFDISFSNHFDKEEIKQNFDISIFADSIVISPRIKTKNIIERLVNFLLRYQSTILLNSHLQSRIIVTRDSFFSLKLQKTSPEYILGSEHTNISLCGGGGIKFLHDNFKGLPLGVYVTEKIKENLNANHKKRLVPIENEKLFFIKQEIDDGAFSLLPKKVRDALCANQDVSIESIRNELRTSHSEEAVKKLLPWILVHIRKQSKICRLWDKNCLTGH